MASFTDAVEVDILKLVTGQTTSIYTTTPPTNVYVGLTTGSTPTDSTGGTEVATGSYARVQSVGKWGTPSAGAVANTTAVAFPTATADWGSITGFELWTASTSGTRVAWGLVTKTIQNGDTASFAIGQLTITLD